VVHDKFQQPLTSCSDYSTYINHIQHVFGARYLQKSFKIVVFMTYGCDQFRITSYANQNITYFRQMTTVWIEGLKLQLTWWSHNYKSYIFKYFIFQYETTLEKLQKLLGARTKCGHFGAIAARYPEFVDLHVWLYLILQCELECLCSCILNGYIIGNMELQHLSYRYSLIYLTVVFRKK
jgi:hypothetical protein